MDGTGASVCTDCMPGHHSNETGSTSCSLCPVGSYANGEGNDVCLACPPGQFCPDKGGKAPKVCPPGTVTDKSSQTSCEPCVMGTYQDASGAAVCNLCPKGTHNNDTGASSLASCVPCAPGSFNPNAGAEQCLPCASDSYAPARGSHNCTTCPANMLGSADRESCVEDERLKAPLSQPSMVEILFSKGVAIYGAVIIAVAYTALAAVLQYKKEQRGPSKVAQLDRLPALLKSILPGFSFGSEVFLIIGMRESAPVLAFIILTFRMLHVVVGVGLNLCMFGPLESAERLDRLVRPSKVSTLRHQKDDSYCRENLPFVGLLVLLSVTDVTMLQFMPWKAPNKFYAESKGMPNMTMLKVCLVTKAVQTTVSVVCQIAFLTAKTSLNDSTTSAQAKGLFIGNIVISFTNVLLGMVMLCLKGELLKSIHEDGTKLASVAPATAGSSQADSRSAGDMEAPRRRDSEDMHLDDIYGHGEEGDAVVSGPNPMTENPLHTTPVPAVLEAGRDDGGSGSGGSGSGSGSGSGGDGGEKNRQKEREAWVRERESLQGELQSERRESAAPL